MSSVILKWVLMCIFCSPVLSTEKWSLAVNTGTHADAKTDGNVYFQLQGDIQDSQLYNLDGPGNDFENGETNVFQLETPFLGHLQFVKMSYKSQDKWFLEKMILTNLITNGICRFQFNNWFPESYSWNASDLECASVLRSSSSSVMTSRTIELTSSLGLQMVQTSPTYFYQTSRTLIESSGQKSQAILHPSTELHPSPSMNEHQTLTASEELKRSFAHNPVISLTASQDMQITSEPDMSQTSRPLLFTTETSTNPLGSFQVEQTTTRLGGILSSAYVLSTNRISESFSHTPVSSTQELVSSSKLCIPWIQVIENGAPSMENSSCVCRLMNSSSLSKEAKIRQLIKELTVDPKSLSKYKRKKISAPDHRVSAQAIGYVGVVTLVAPFALIVILDLMTFTKYYLGN
ncbi:uro-adherence factor A [Octopus bimaculoides]|uniref:PLAT domain-containing protein n=1 Tax=Octopus bimaculoides TaxID=37653 RepID=A0A0L8FJD4_OCTBM|nr:uro-adherence factor A [Octopus bimaculoides]|eukprot:XP_014789291.1 PREDICTED: uro-adherence factor A-like [Octopus bimaculoides]